MANYIASALTRDPRFLIAFESEEPVENPEKGWNEISESGYLSVFTAPIQSVEKTTDTRFKARLYSDQEDAEEVLDSLVEGGDGVSLVGSAIVGVSVVS